MVEFLATIVRFGGRREDFRDQIRIECVLSALLHCSSSYSIGVIDACIGSRFKSRGSHFRTKFAAKDCLRADLELAMQVTNNVALNETMHRARIPQQLGARSQAA